MSGSSPECDHLIRIRPPQHAGDTTGDANVRLGIVGMTRNPHRLDTWLMYHHVIVGVERFFLHVENTAWLSSLLSRPPWCEVVVAKFVEREDSHYDYFTLMHRQVEHVNASIGLARDTGLTHIAHIDDDELIYCASGVEEFRRALGRAASPSASLKNIEAIIPHHACDDVFRECTAFRCCPSRFCAYSNGKSIGFLGCADLKAHGPHHFRGSMPTTPDIVETYQGCILHYESGTFARWLAKFSGLARRHTRDPKQISSIPFPFYKESIAAAQALIDAGDASGVEERDAALRLWQRWKMEKTRRLPLPSRKEIIEVDGGCNRGI